MKEAKVGLNQSIYLTNPLDVWTHEARGSSARVFFGALENSTNIRKPAAVKIMRPDKIDYALPLFIEEIKILKAIDDIPGVVRISEVGFIKPDSGFEFPDDATLNGCNLLTGKVLRWETDENLDTHDIENKVSQGWLPYIAMSIKNHQDNLLMLCDRARTSGHKPFPTKYAIDASAQICGILAQAHQRNIVYLDHKILHYYWNDNLSHAYVIDWNVGKLHSNLSDTHKQFDIIQFGARALYFIFTGRSAPGALALGPTRPDEIEHAPHQYTVDWHYDDKDIPNTMKEIISSVLKGEYLDAAILQKEITSCIVK